MCNVLILYTITPPHGGLRGTTPTLDGLGLRFETRDISAFSFIRGEQANLTEVVDEHRW